MRTIEETAVFIVHAIKQFCFGFEEMDKLADEYADGSAGKAFFLSAIYQHLAVFCLIAPEGRPMGGAFYPALATHGLEELLDPIRPILREPLGWTTFGEVVRVFRNKALVHPGYSDADLDRIYRDVDMSRPEVARRWHELLVQAYVETKQLAVRVAKATGRPLSDFGIDENGAIPSS
ncbi:MAG: hypothetical protein KDC98_01175 [Planctomycetes bacterium]|nr:hypothetical protein [Planctomycetota bacterium]